MNKISHQKQTNQNLELHKCHRNTDFLILTLAVSLSSGGAELLFDGVKEHHVTLPGQSEPCEYPNLHMCDMK